MNKFYFLGILYLRMKNYEQARNCFEAALLGNLADKPSLIGLAYSYSKMGIEKEYKKIINHIHAISKDAVNIVQSFKELEKTILKSNPFEPCDVQCNKNNKFYLCKNCFFNYVSEDIFMKKVIDDVFEQKSL